MKFFNNIKICEYNSKYRDQVESFRKQSFLEGNSSLSYEKYNPDTIKGQTWLTFIDENLASLSVCEASKYTGDPKIAARIGRYHILKKYRHCNAGFRMLPYQVEWAKHNHYKVIYWTHNISNKALNALYKKRRIMLGKKQFFETELYQSFKWQKNMIFKVSMKSDFIQFIYAKTLEPGFEWKPRTNVIFLDNKEDSIDISKVLENAKSIQYS